MPYGGTVDGVKYLYAGNEVKPDATGSAGYDGRKIEIQGKAVEVAEGAVLDVSGGGELSGGAFVRGRGGSVDVLRYAMADANPGFGFSRSGNAVYAIVPGFAGNQAPIAADTGAGSPAVGRQVTIGAGVPGLPAGTYTLLPSTYALLPGAFRVELGAQGAYDAWPRTRGGSWVGSGWLGTAGTAQRRRCRPACCSRRATYCGAMRNTTRPPTTLSPGGRGAQGHPARPDDRRRPRAAADPGRGRGHGSAAGAVVQGLARFGVPKDSGGYAGSLVVNGPAQGLEILAAGQTPILGPKAAAIQASDLNALSAGAMFLGGTPGRGVYDSGQMDVYAKNTQLLRSGAVLSAPEIFLYAASGGAASWSSRARRCPRSGAARRRWARTGTYYALTSGALLAVSNGLVNLMAPAGGAGTDIDVGGCVAACGGASLLLSEGSIGAATSGGFTWRDTVQYGTRNLALSVSAVNLGSAQALQQAGAAGHLPPGLEMNQDVLATLLRGNTALGAPALESLILNANESINVYGAVALDARGAGGRSLQRLLGAPAIYGYGAAGDTATIAAGEFIWAGAIAADRNGINVGAKPQAPGGAMLDQLGHGKLNVVADTIRLESSPYQLPNDLVTAERLLLGFSSVTLDAAKMIAGRARGGLSVYHEQDGYNAQDGWRYRGGDLLIRTPLLTGEAGSVMTVKAGGALSVAGTGAAAAARDALGATINLAGRSVSLDTTVALPFGKAVDQGRRQHRAGRGFAHRPGRPRGASVRPAALQLGRRPGTAEHGRRYHAGAGALIDVSARNNRAGRVQAIALGDSAGRIDLGGTLRATASGRYDAGGTLVPYEGGEAVLRAQALADFGELNARLTEGGFFGARRFQIKRGDLTVGDELRARNVELVVDGGSLTVNGRIDASGPQVGSIRLAAMGDLVINGVLDAHSTTLRVDSYGKIIDSANRAIVDLTSRTGSCRWAPAWTCAPASARRTTTAWLAARWT